MDSRPVSGYGACLRGNDGAVGRGRGIFTWMDRMDRMGWGVDSGLRGNDGAEVAGYQEETQRSRFWVMGMSTLTPPRRWDSYMA